MRTLVVTIGLVVLIAGGLLFHCRGLVPHGTPPQQNGDVLWYQHKDHWISYRVHNVHWVAPWCYAITGESGYWTYEKSPISVATQPTAQKTNPRSG